MESLLIKIFIKVVAKLRPLQIKLLTTSFYFLFYKYLVRIYCVPEHKCILFIFKVYFLFSFKRGEEGEKQRNVDVR